MSEFFSAIWHFNNGLPRFIFYALVAWLGFTLVAFLLSRKFAPAVQQRLDEEKHPIFSIMLQGFRRPVSVLLQISGIAFALLIFSAWRPEDGNNFWLKIVTGLPFFGLQSLAYRHHFNCNMGAYVLQQNYPPRAARHPQQTRFTCWRKCCPFFSRHF